MDPLEVLTIVPWITLGDAWYRFVMKLVYKVETNPVILSHFPFFSCLFANCLALWFSTRKLELLQFGLNTMSVWCVIFKPLKLDKMKDDESDKLGQTLASVYWKGFLEHVAKDLRKHHFEDFVQSYPEYNNTFLDHRFYVLIPKSLDHYPKYPDKENHGIEKISSEFCHIEVTPTRTYRRPPIRLNAFRVYNGNNSVSVVYDFPYCLRTHLKKFKDENVRRVNLRSFIRTLKEYLKSHPDHIVTFLEVTDHNFEKQPDVYAKALYSAVSSI